MRRSCDGQPNRTPFGGLSYAKPPYAGYSKTLKQQLAELNDEKSQIEMEFRQRFNIDYQSLGFNAKPTSIMRLLAQDIASHQRDLHFMQLNLNGIIDVKSLKIWLKVMNDRDMY